MNADLPERLPVEKIMGDMAQAIKPMLNSSSLLVAICSGGVWIAEHLHRQLEISEPLGLVDISFYRDDFSRAGLNPKVHTSSLPVAIDGRHIILVDDILHTGRTVRAAVNELFAWGRPASVGLAVLVDRGGLELPYRAQVVGHRIALEKNQFVKVLPSGDLNYFDFRIDNE